MSAEASHSSRGDEHSGYFKARANPPMRLVPVGGFVFKSLWSSFKPLRQRNNADFRYCSCTQAMRNFERELGVRIS